jgi:hypothetical protein
MRLEIPANPVLADRARQVADAAPRGSLARKSYGCAAIALGESTSIAGARKVLDLLWQDDVRQAALDVITQLATRPEE